MKKRIVCFGDSNTWGLRAGLGKRFDENTRWTALLQNKLGSNYVVIEEGQNGRTCVLDDPCEGEKNAFKYILPCVESQAPFDLIIIMLGTNDLKLRFSLTALEIGDGLGRLVEKLRGYLNYNYDMEDTKILITAPIHIGDNIENTTFGYLFGGKDGISKSKELASYYKLIAEKYDCDFVDASEVAEASYEDAVHLDELGHKKLSEMFYEKVKELLG